MKGTLGADWKESKDDPGEICRLTAEVKEMQKQIEDAYKEMILENERKRREEAFARVEKAKNEKELRVTLEKGKRVRNLAELAETAKANRRKNEILLEGNRKKQKQLTEEFMREFGQIGTEKEESELIEYEISQDEMQIIEKLSPTEKPENRNYWEKGETEEEAHREGRGLLGGLGNSSLLNEKDISLNYSGLENLVLANEGPVKESEKKGEMESEKRYFTKEFNRDFSKGSNEGKREDKKVGGIYKRAGQAGKISMKKTLKKSKINKPPRIQKKQPKHKNKPIEPIEASLDISQKYQKSQENNLKQ